MILHEQNKKGENKRKKNSEVFSQTKIRWNPIQLIETAFMVYRRSTFPRNISHKSKFVKGSSIQGSKSCLRPFVNITCRRCKKVIWYCFWACKLQSMKCTQVKSSSSWTSIEFLLDGPIYHIMMVVFILDLVNCFRWFVRYRFEIKNPTRNLLFRCKLYHVELALISYKESS